MNNNNMKTVTAIDAVINNKLAECGVSHDALPSELRERLNARFLAALTETNVEREFLRLRTSRRENQPDRLTLRGVSDEEYRTFVEQAGYFPSAELIANVKARHASHLGPSFLGDIWHAWGKDKATEKKAAEASQHEASASATNKSQSKTSKPQEKVDTSAPVETRNVGVKNALPTTSPEHRSIAPNATVIPASTGRQNRGSSSEYPTPHEGTAEARNVGVQNTPSAASPEQQKAAPNRASVPVLSGQQNLGSSPGNPAPRERTVEARNVGAKNAPPPASPEGQCATPNGASIPAPAGRQDRGSTLEEPVYRADPNSIGGVRDKRSCINGDTSPQSVSSSSLDRTPNEHSSDVAKPDGNAAASPGSPGGPPVKPLAGGQNASASPATPKGVPASAPIKSTTINNGGTLL